MVTQQKISLTLIEFAVLNICQIGHCDGVEKTTKIVNLCLQWALRSQLRIDKDNKVHVVMYLLLFLYQETEYLDELERYEVYLHYQMDVEHVGEGHQ